MTAAVWAGIYAAFAVGACLTYGHESRHREGRTLSLLTAVLNTFCFVQTALEAVTR